MKYSNLAVMNASKAASEACSKKGFSNELFDRVYDDVLSEQPDENFYTGAVYDNPPERRTINCAAMLSRQLEA